MSALTDALRSISRDPGNPLFGLTPWPAWESSEHQEMAVVKVGTTYYMFYAGGNGASVQLGLLTTPAASYPYGWTRYSTSPVLPCNTQPGIDNVVISQPYLVHMQDGSWRLYYCGWNGAGQGTVGCVATATAGGFPGTWTKSPSNPIYPKGSPGAWDADGIRVVAVLPPWESGLSDWRAITAGYNAAADLWKVGHARSSDGLAWTRDASPMLSPTGTIGTGWESGYVYPFACLKDGSQWILVYGGTNAQAGLDGMGGPGVYWDMGYATGPDPSGPWTRYSGNPIFTHYGTGWEKMAATLCSFVQDPSGRLDAWYIGSGTDINAGFNIGRAYAAMSVPGQDADRTDAATLGASQGAAYQPAGRLTVSAGPVVGGKVTLSGHRIPGSVVYVSR
jgi:hypothetical protein